MIETHKEDNSDAKIVFGLPVIQAPENLWGDSRVAGEPINSVQETQAPNSGEYKAPAITMKVQREPPFLFDRYEGHAQQPHYMST